jgi:FLVCR family feline leukemia virus subgroup C receptor-related protein
MTFLFSLYFGGLKAYGVLASYLVEPYGYNPSIMIILSIVPIFSGFITTILLGLYLKKYKNYKILIYIVCTGTAIFFGTLSIPIATKNMTFLIIYVLLIGFFMVPGNPLMLEFATEITYPIGESLTIGVLIASGQIMGVLLGYIGG